MIQKHYHNFCTDLCNIFHNSLILLFTFFFKPLLFPFFNLYYFLCHMCYCLYALARIMELYVFFCHYEKIFFIFCTNRVFLQGIISFTLGADLPKDLTLSCVTYIVRIKVEISAKVEMNLSYFQASSALLIFRIYREDIKLR